MQRPVLRPNVALHILFCDILVCLGLSRKFFCTICVMLVSHMQIVMYCCHQYGPRTVLNMFLRWSTCKILSVEGYYILSVAFWLATIPLLTSSK